MHSILDAPTVEAPMRVAESLWYLVQPASDTKGPAETPGGKTRERGPVVGCLGNGPFDVKTAPSPYRNLDHWPASSTSRR
jgi:hypothetical protein